MKEYLITLLLAMTPISEVRGAIPYAMANGIAFPFHLLLPIAGNIFIIPWLLLLLEPVFKWLKNWQFLHRFNNWIDRYQTKAVEKVTKRHESVLLLALFLFVAIPLPTTGVYTASLAAVVLKVPKLHAFLSLALGVLVASGIVYLASLGVIHLF
ncbi:MAG: small multi-drug export protein [Tissierellia bacterium]|nr:small multi-drug export protein [Tissierellia bacterium]